QPVAGVDCIERPEVAVADVPGAGAQIRLETCLTSRHSEFVLVVQRLRHDPSPLSRRLSERLSELIHVAFGVNGILDGMTSKLPPRRTLLTPPPSDRAASSVSSMEETTNASLIGVLSRACGGLEISICEARSRGIWTIDSSSAGPVRTA